MKTVGAVLVVLLIAGMGVGCGPSLAEQRAKYKQDGIDRMVEYCRQTSQDYDSTYGDFGICVESKAVREARLNAQLAAEKAATAAHDKAKAECERLYPKFGDPQFNCLLPFHDTPEGKIYDAHAIAVARAAIAAQGPTETSVNNPRQNFLVGCDYGYTTDPNTGAVKCNSKPVDVRVVQ